MGKAGDGLPRSSTRQRTRIMRARVTPDEESRIRAAAHSRGHRSAADYLRERALEDTPGTRVPASVIGELGILGSIMAEASAVLQRVREDEAALRCSKASQRIARMQRLLMEDEDAGEGHRAPAPRPGR